MEVGETLEEEVEEEVEVEVEEEQAEAEEEQAQEEEEVPSCWGQNLETSPEIAWTSTAS